MDHSLQHVDEMTSVAMIPLLVSKYVQMGMGVGWSDKTRVGRLSKSAVVHGRAVGPMAGDAMLAMGKAPSRPIICAWSMPAAACTAPCAPGRRHNNKYRLCDHGRAQD